MENVKENQLTVNNQSVEVMAENENFVMDLTQERVTCFCSFEPKTLQEKKRFYNIINSSSKRIGDCINETINMKDVYVEIVKCTNKETGEVTECPRTIIIDDKGEGYQAVSLGIFGALKKIFQVFGQPNTWDTVLPIKVKQVTKGEKKILTLECK